VGQDFSFTATASDPHANITDYSWDFGDGSPAGSGATVSHPYQRAGTYTVTLTVTADNGTSTTVTQQLTVGPVAAFTFTPAGPQNGTQVAFQSTSTDPEPGSPAITGYSWDFGDGQSSTDPSPTHIYADPRTYTVTLTVTNNDGETDTISHAITVADIPPTAAITVTTPVPAVNQPVAFDGSASSPSDPRAAIVSYAWSLGDGATATGATPTHTYALPGTYMLQLTVTDSYGVSTTTQRQVLVHAPPTAAFTSSPGHPLEGTVLAFDGTSSRELEPGVQVSSYVWSFGDGATAAGSHPTHAYASAGTYTVTLTVTNSLALSATSTQRVSVVAPPRASFVVRTARPATGQPVNFAATSAAVTYHWVFGDGSAAASGANASHVFRRAATYLVTLTVTDSFGHTAATTTRVSVAQAGRITKVTVRGTKLVLALNGPGTLNAAGRTIRVKRAGAVTLPIRLTAPQRRSLALGHRLTLRLLVRFNPAAGPRLRKTVIVTFRPAHAATARLAGA
jgi:PKD repeat protein